MKTNKPKRDPASLWAAIIVAMFYLFLLLYNGKSFASTFWSGCIVTLDIILIIEYFFDYDDTEKEKEREEDEGTK